MSRLFWIRHGPTHEKAFVGHRDVPADLSDTEALARLEAELPKDGLVVSSDLCRSIATADAIQAGRQRLPNERDLREFDFGLWDGLRFDQVAAQWPEVSRSYWETPGEIAPPGGESWNAAARRVSASVDRLTAQHAGRDLILVAHFGVILTQLQRAMGVTAGDVLAHKIDPLSLTEITAKTGAVRINHQP